MKTLMVKILPRVIIFAVLVMLLSLGLVASTPAQQTAKIRGVVFDQQNAVVARATIRIESKTFETTFVASEDGRFELELPLGSYEVSIEPLGFKKYLIRNYQLEAGFNPELVIRLETIPQLPHPPVAVPEPEVTRSLSPNDTIKAIHAPAFQRIGPIILK